MSMLFHSRFIPLWLAVSATLLFGAGLASIKFTLWLAIPLAVAAVLVAVGIHDLRQPSHSILRNYPILAHMRFIFEAIRPELRQYFFEGDKDGTPFSRDRRAIVYQRAKMQLDVRPFGTQYDVYSIGYEWMHHSIAPRPVTKDPFRIMIGDVDCTKPYSASVFNISAMSFGSLSANAIRALNGGAKLGGFAHDTGEGGYSPYHREGGGDIIWEVGSGYFGCRNPDGTFNADKFAEGASNPQVKMVELKLSQGAKPGHGGVLPAPKVSAEIAQTRGVPVGEDCISPSSHSAFTTPIEMMQFIAKMRELSGGKPAGFKLCIGHEWEFLAICKANAGDGHLSRLHRGRRQGGRHRGGTAGIHRPYRQADAPGPVLRAQRRGRHRRAPSHQARRGGQDHHRLRHDPRHGARRRLVQCGARLHVRRGLHPVPVLPHRSMPDRRRHPGPAPPAGTGRARQDAARRQLPSCHPARAGRDDRSGRPRSSE
jgi:hypothetical protein